MESQRLIETHFPVIEISRASVREKRVKAHHPSGIHLWPGRRPLAACRAGILSTHFAVPKNLELLQELFDIISRFAPLSSGSEKNGLLRPKGNACRFLDPFGGGGSFALEAAKAGFKVSTNDLNPVAFLIQRATVEFPVRLGAKTLLLPEFGRKGAIWEHVNFWGRWVLAETKAELPDLYSIDDALCPSYFLWSWQLDCPKCGLRFPLLKTRTVLRGAENSVVLVLTPERRGNSCSVDYVKSGANSKEVGNFDLSGAHCPRCKTITPRKAVQDLGCRKEMTRRLLAKVWRASSGFQVSPPAPDEQRRAEHLDLAIQTCFREIPFGLPNETITGDFDNVRVPIYGFTNYSQLFFPRQMLAIGTIVKQTRRALKLLQSQNYPKPWQEAIGVYLAMVVGRLVERNSQLCLWQPKKTCVSSVYARYTMPFCADFVEANILGDRSGAYLTQLEKVVQATQALCSNFSASPGNASVRCLNRDVARGFCGKFDLIAADPPYYDSLSYGNLSDYFYVWIRRTLHGFFPAVDVSLSDSLTPKLTEGGGELIQDRSRHQGSPAKSNQNLAAQTLKAFSSLKNALNPDGRILFVFAASFLEAWGIVADAIQTNELSVSAAWPIITEDIGRPRSKNSHMLSASIWLCLRHRRQSQTASLSRALNAFRRQLPQIRLNIKKWALPLADQRWYMTAVALSVFSRWAIILDAKGQRIYGREFLKKAAPLIDPDRQPG